MTTNTHLLLKKIEKEIKLGVIITDVIMTIYVMWLIATNDSTWLIGVLFGFTPFGAFELLRASKLFHFCVTHKLMLLHTVAVYLCCVYQAQIGFGFILPIMRWIMFISGIILILVLTIKLTLKE